MRLFAPVPLLIALVALAAGSVLVLWRGDEAEIPAPDLGAMDATAEGDETGLADGSLAGGSLPTDLDGDSLPAERSSVPSEPEDEPLPGEELVGTLVTVVRLDEAGKWQTAAGVEVAWMAIDEGRREVSLLPAPQRVRDCEIPFRFGPRARTGSDGTLRLPPSTTPWFLAARAEGQFAFATPRGNNDRVRLELNPDETLTVVVVREDQQRVPRAPLALLRWRTKEGLETFWNGESDRKGELVLPHFQLLRPGHQSGERFFVGAAMPLQQQVAVEFAARPAGPEPVLVVLPATRPLAVAVVHKGGAPLLARLDVSFVPVRPKPTQPLPVSAGRWDRMHVQKPLGARPFDVPHVGPGIELVPYLRLPSEDEPRRLPPIRVPTEGSGPVDVVLRLPDDVRVVALRAVTKDGEPLASASLPWQLQRPLANGSSGNLETLPDGAGDFVVPRDGAPDSPTSPDPLTLVLRETIDRETVLGSQSPLGALLRGERRDLGTVVMAPLPLLVHGRAVDDLGEPRVGQTVRVELAPVTDQKAWPTLPNVRGPVGEDGTFAVFAPAPTRAFRVVLGETDQHFPVRSDLLSPGTYVELVQPRAGVLHGRVVPPQGLADGALTVSLVRDGNGVDPNARVRPRTAPLRRRSRYFRIDKLEPGTYTLSIAMRGLPGPLATFPGVFVGPGDNRDPRFDPADLSATLHKYELVAVGPGGVVLTSLEGPVMWKSRDAAGNPSYTAFRWQKGRAEFWLPVPYADFVVVGTGIPATEVSVAAGVRDVLLNPITPYPVELPGVRALAGPERAIRVSAVFVGDTGLPEGIGGQDQQRGDGFQFPRNQMGKSGGGWLDGADRTGLVVSRPGTYQLTLRLYATAAREGRQAAIELGLFPVVVDGSSLQPLVVPVDSAALQRALASLQPQPLEGPGGRPNSRRR